MASARRVALVDAGAWIALLHAGDRHASRAVGWYRGDPTVQLVTTNYVLDEAATRLRYDVSLRHALQLRDQVASAVDRGSLEVVWIDAAIEQGAWDVLGRYSMIKLSFTDATSVIVAKRLKIKTIFGFDSDFRALGFDLVPG